MPTILRLIQTIPQIVDSILLLHWSQDETIKRIDREIISSEFLT